MKVLQISKYYSPFKGGIETVAKQLAESRLLNEDFIYTTIAAHHQTRQKTRVEKLSPYSTLHRTFTLFRIMSIPISFKMIWAIQSAYKHHDLVHLHHPNPMVELYLVLKMILQPKPLVITFHANASETKYKLFSFAYYRIIRSLLWRAKKIVVTSEGNLVFDHSLQAFKKKIKVIPLATEMPDEMKPRVAHPSKQRHNLLFVGRLSYYKGIHVLIEAFKMLQLKGVACKLAIVGNGELLSKLQELVAEYNLEEEIQFYVDADDALLASLYEQSDLFVLPSISRAEAFGIVQLEAMAHGLPVVNTSLKSGVPYVSLHNETGLTVEPNDAHALSEAIHTLLTNHKLYNRFSRKCQSRVKLFSIPRMVEQYQRVYSEVLSVEQAPLPAAKLKLANGR